MKSIKIKKRYFFLLMLVVSLLWLAFAVKESKASKFVTKKLERCTIVQLVEASGTINPVNTVSVGSTVSGLIKAIYVDYNSEVKKGQLLAQIDPANFEAAVQQNNAAIISAKANLAKLQAVAEMDKKTLTRYTKLYQKNFIAKSDLDQAQRDYASDIAQISAARAQISQAEAQYKTAMTNLSYTKIIAPVDGTVIARKIDLGQPVAASFQAPELFTIAQDLKKMQIEVNVSEADIGKIKEGQDVTYTLDGYPDSEFKGRVTQVRISPTTVSNVVTYSVIVAVQNDELKLKPGMTANVSIITEKRENVLCVPNIALKFSLAEGKKGPERIQKYKNQGVWVLKNNRPLRFDVETGATSDSSTEVMSDELKEGDLVILEQNLKGHKNNQKGNKPPMRMF